jgi:hypothetical protein
MPMIIIIIILQYSTVLLGNGSPLFTSHLGSMITPGGHPPAREARYYAVRGSSVRRDVPKYLCTQSTVVLYLPHTASDPPPTLFWW